MRKRASAQHEHVYRPTIKGRVCQCGAFAPTNEGIRASLAPDAWKGVYPGMCLDPEVCRGYSHCPRDYSCCE